MRILACIILSLSLFACEGSDSSTKESESKSTKETQEADVKVKKEDANSQTKRTEPRENVRPNTDPRHIAETIFNSAYSQDFSQLSQLCHEDVETDGWGRQVCMIANAREKGIDTFIGMFEQGRVVGEVLINDGVAQVPVVYGPDGVQDGFLYAILHEDLWYLRGFTPPGE